MSNITVTTPSFVFGYWRPWNEKSNFTESYLDYVKDVSLVKYGADVVGNYIQAASREQVSAIQELGNSIGRGLDVLSDKLDDVKSELRFLNANTEILIEQQRLSNILLGDIIELLRVSDSEKERQHSIELGVKFFINAQKDFSLFDDALEQFVKAEALMKQDYFVLHRIGCIHLYVESHLDIEKARDYFIRSAKYSSVETGTDAARLANALTENLLNRQRRLDQINGIIENFNSNNFPGLKEINVIDLKYKEDKIYFSVASEVVSNPLIESAAELVVRLRQASVTLLQVRLKLSYTRSCLLFDELEKVGVIGSFDGTSFRKVLIDDVNLLKPMIQKFRQDPNNIKDLIEHNADIISAEDLLENEKGYEKIDLIRKDVIEISSKIENVNLKYQYYGTNSLKALTADSFQKAAFCSYILNEQEKAVTYQKEAADLIDSPENLFLLAKYQARNNEVSEAVVNLNQAIDLVPEMALAVFKEIDLLNTYEVLNLIEKKNKEVNSKIKDLIEEWREVKSKVASEEINNLEIKLNSSFEIKVASYTFSKQKLIETIERINIEKQLIDETISEFNKKTVAQSTDNLIESLDKSKELMLEEMHQQHVQIEEMLNNAVVRIGSNYQGGIVFHIDESGNHGLVCSEKIIGCSIWGSDERNFGTQTKLGSGKINTEIIERRASTKMHKLQFFLSFLIFTIWCGWPIIGGVLRESGVSAALVIENGVNWWIRLGVNISLQIIIAKVGGKNRIKLDNSTCVCIKSDLNGYRDWYLPSIDELALINKNLYSTGQLGNLDNHSCWSSSEFCIDFSSSGQKNKEACSFHFKKPKSEIKYENRLTEKSILVVRSF